MVKHVPSKREGIVKLINEAVGHPVAAVEQILGELGHGPRAVAENMTEADGGLLEQLKALGAPVKCASS
jgi:hypothetical protein